MSGELAREAGLRGSELINELTARHTSVSIRDSMRVCQACRSGGLDSGSSAKRMDDLEDSREAGIAVLAEALVQAFTADAGLLGDLARAAGLGDIANGGLLAAFYVSCEQEHEYVRLLRKVDEASGADVVTELGGHFADGIDVADRSASERACRIRATIQLRSLLFLRALSQSSNSSTVLISMTFIVISENARRQGTIPACAGNTMSGFHLFLFSRTIPACAGNTVWARPHGWSTWDHPRIRGEHRRVSVFGPFMGDHPRMRGEHKENHKPKPRKSGSSPHARGTYRMYLGTWFHGGIIPACAGNM